MGSIDKYIFRTTLASVSLVSDQPDGRDPGYAALRGIDLMTARADIRTFPRHHQSGLSPRWC